MEIFPSKAFRIIKSHLDCHMSLIISPLHLGHFTRSLQPSTVGGRSRLAGTMCYNLESYNKLQLENANTLRYVTAWNVGTWSALSSSSRRGPRRCSGPERNRKEGCRWTTAHLLPAAQAPGREKLPRHSQDEVGMAAWLDHTTVRKGGTAGMPAYSRPSQHMQGHAHPLLLVHMNIFKN